MKQAQRLTGALYFGSDMARCFTADKRHEMALQVISLVR